MEKWFVIGDIHGHITAIEFLYQKCKGMLSPDASENHLLLLGDVGANYFLNDRDLDFKRELSKYPFTYVCLRGNHESRVEPLIARDPDKWERKQKYDGEIYVEKDFPMIEYLSDTPALYDFCGYKTLSIPGAYSVDKWYRLSHHFRWFKDEQLTEKEMVEGRDLIDDLEPGGLDLVISHTCPISFEPTDLFLSCVEQSSVDKTMEMYLGEIEYSLQYKGWLFGHYHDTRLYPNHDGKNMAMLFDNAIDLDKFMTIAPNDCIDDIMVQ